MPHPDPTNSDPVPPAGPDTRWPALWALILGFFMLLVDSTIVTVATPALLTQFGNDVSYVVWVTSAYLLAYVVPLLITGRLGDRYGPKRVYLIGLAIFTVASLACGLATSSLAALIVARVVQGLGASLMSPQTMAIITRLFPPGERGQAMGLWGATAGVATLAGPLLGGILIDAAGWPLIFFVNVPVGLLGLILAYRLVPVLETHNHRFDWLGVALSGVGTFLLVFGIEEGPTYDWGMIAGPIGVWPLIISGLVVLGAFGWWQTRARTEPLIPPVVFAHRNFTLANVGVFLMGLAVTAMPFPLMIWVQEVRGLTPTQAALTIAPLAIVSGIASPLAGRTVDRMHPRVLATAGLAGMALSVAVMAGIVGYNLNPWWLLLPTAALGLASAFIWGPLSVTATTSLPVTLAGAGSGVYNATRQLGAVIGAAAVAAIIESRLAVEPASLAYGHALWLPTIAALIGGWVTLGFQRPAHQQGGAGRRAAGGSAQSNALKQDEALGQ